MILRYTFSGLAAQRSLIGEISATALDGAGPRVVPPRVVTGERTRGARRGMASGGAPGAAPAEQPSAPCAGAYGYVQATTCPSWSRARRRPLRFAGAAARTALTSYGPRGIGARAHRPRKTLDHVDR